MKLLLLHGYDSSPASLEPLRRRILATWPQAVVSIPVGFVQVTPGSFGWWEPTEESPSEALAELAPLISDAIVIGFSQGGALALAAYMLGFAPRAACSVAGFGPEAALNALSDLDATQARPGQLLLVHGEDDPVVDAFYSETFARKARAKAIPVELSLVEGVHEWNEAMYAAVLNWISQLVKPFP